MNIDERIRNFIDEELKDFNLDSGSDIEEINKKFIKVNSNSLAHRIEGKGFLPDLQIFMKII